MVLEAWGGIADDILDIIFRFFVPLYSLFFASLLPLFFLCTSSMPFPAFSLSFCVVSAPFCAFWGALERTVHKGEGGELPWRRGQILSTPRFFGELLYAFSRPPPHRFPRNLEETPAPHARTSSPSYRTIGARPAEKSHFQSLWTVRKSTPGNFEGLGHGRILHGSG